MANPFDPDALDRFAQVLASLAGPGGGLDRFQSAISQIATESVRSFPTLTPVATPVGGPPVPPAPTASPLAGGSPLRTVLQPLNVQMAELVGVTKLILAAVVAGGSGGGPEVGQEAREAVAERPAFLARLQAGLQGLQQSAALAGIGFGILNRALGEISNQITQYVQAFSPTAVKLFNFALLDLQGSIGEILLPVLRNFQVVVRGIADGIASLSPAGRAALAGLAAGTVALVALTAAAVAFSVAVNSALGGIPALLGLVAGTLTATAGGAAFALKDQAEVQRLVERVAAPATAALNALGEVLLSLAPVIEAVLVTQLTTVADVLKDLAGVLVALAPLIKIQAEVTGAVLRVVAAVVRFASPLALLANVLDQLGLTESTFKRDASQGKGIREAQFTSVDEFLKKAQIAAFSTPNERPKAEDQTAKNTLTMALLLEAIDRNVSTLAKAAGSPAQAVERADAVRGQAVDFLAQQMIDLMRLR